MTVMELEQEISKNKQRIAEIDAILSRSEYSTVEQAQELRLESQRLRDGLPLLEREINRIKTQQRERELEKARKRLPPIIDKGQSLELKIYTGLIEIIKNATALRISKQQYHEVTTRFPELGGHPNTAFPSQALEDRVIKAILRSDTPRPSTQTWKKLETEWHEARKKFFSY